MQNPPRLSIRLFFLGLILATCVGAAGPDGGEASPYLRLWGRLHPVLVHFPVALIVTAGLLEVLRRRSRFPERSEHAFVCLALGTLSAVVAASMGWFNAELEGHGRSVERLIFLHRWAGVGVAVLAALTLLCAALHRSGGGWKLKGYRFGLLGCVLLVGWSSHLGGSLVYGEDYLTQVFEEEDAGGVDPLPPDGLNGGTQREGVSYERDIRPIFRASCVECHGRSRPRGKLRLDVMSATFERDPSLWAIRPGDPDGSELVRRIELPPEDEDAMPSEGEPLNTEQVALIRRWIEEGATWEGGAPPGGEVATGTGEPGGQTTAPAPVEVLESLRNAGVSASRVAQDTELVEVNFSLKPGVGDADLSQLTGLEETLSSLNLGRTGVTDGGLARIAGFAALRKLYLNNTAVGDAGLAHLEGLEELEYLNLYGTRVTDAGLRHLHGLPKLRKVFVWQTGVTEAGVRALEAAVAEVEVTVD